VKPRPRSGTESRWRRFYAVVARIPEGYVATYGQVAAIAGFPGNAREVGYALAALPEEIDVPWQRVINARGEVSLRREPGRDGFQRHLLEEEGVVFSLEGRVDLRRFGWQPGRVKARRTALGAQAKAGRTKAGARR
jgi:methylated-DNA-protein-cysteine methyltransferase-like protein